MGLITKLSGLLKAITYTIRVICRVSFIIVQIYENFVVQSLISSIGREGLTGSFAALGIVVELSELQMCLTKGVVNL
jgi:hypothetical protein